MRPRFIVASVVLLLAVWSNEALADDAVDSEPMPSGHLRLTTGPGTLRAPDGRLITLPVQTHVLDDVTWEKMDLEVRRLQDAETRLTAENKSLRASADTWQPGWKSLTGALVTGIVAGWYLHSKF